ncbi:MAG: right-handed parallel beta-helix repeat-containing protein, partial [Planctomycetota bacterium]|nr:right-handed parallel beta-helix repeat-containing protein [Planctomycetota bacterium]
EGRPCRRSAQGLVPHATECEDTLVVSKFISSLALAASLPIFAVGCTSTTAKAPNQQSWYEKLGSSVKSGTDKMTAAIAPKQPSFKDQPLPSPNGKAGPNVLKLDDIPGGGFFYDTQSAPRRLYFRLPAGAKIADCKLELPLNTGFYVSDDYVTVRNIASKYSQDDGFAGFWGQGVVFENINGSYNCDQGISFHGTSTTTIDGGLFERNGGCGIADVMACITVYRGVTVRNNMIAGALLAGHAHAMLGCRVYGNYRIQVETQRDTSTNLSDCLIAGEGPDKGTGASIVNGRMNHCTVVNCQTGVQVSRGAKISNCVFSQIGGNLITVDKDALSCFELSRTILDLGKVTFGGQKLDKDSWAQAAAQLAFASNIILDSPKLRAPGYLLPADSPHYKAGEYGAVPGCHVGEYKDWAPTGGAKEAVPHP